MELNKKSISKVLEEVYSSGSKDNIINLEIPTGNPLLIRFKDNFKVNDFKYLDSNRAKKILFKT